MERGRCVYQTGVGPNHAGKLPDLVLLGSPAVDRRTFAVQRAGGTCVVTIVYLFNSGELLAPGTLQMHFH